MPLTTDYQIAKMLMGGGYLDGLRLKRGIGWMNWEKTLGGSWWPGRSTTYLAALGEKFRNEDQESVAKKLENLSSCQNVLKLLEDFRELTDSPWNHNPYLIGVGNGCYNVLTDEFRLQKPSDYISINTPVMFNKDAECPRFMEFLYSLHENEEISDYLQIVLGTGLFPRTADQTLHIWKGDGSNGKGVLGNIIASTFGDMAGTISSNVLMRRGDDSAIRFALSRLQQCTLLFASEVPKNSTLDENMVKQLTGEEPMVVEEKMKSQESVTFNATLIMRVNDIPKIADASYGMRRRIRVVPFDISFDPHKNQNLVSLLEKEKEGILQWALKGLRSYITTGLPYPESIRMATKEAFKQSFEFADFMDECLAVDPDSKDVSLKNIRLAYIDWATENSQNTNIQSQRIAEAMRNYMIGINEKHPHNATVYDGVRITRVVRGVRM